MLKELVYFIGWELDLTLMLVEVQFLHPAIYTYVSFYLFSAPVQAYFVLEKPVSQLVPRIGRLEYDITAEIGVPDMKVLPWNFLPVLHCCLNFLQMEETTLKTTFFTH